VVGLVVFLVLVPTGAAHADTPGGERYKRCIRYAVRVLDLSRWEAIRFCTRSR
jgi:hypothetical protein